MLILSDFHHYAIHLLLDVYPLSQSEFVGASLPRRASYSYINEIVEGAQTLAAHLLQRLEQAVPKTWSGRIRRAGVEGCFPSPLVEALLELRSLRNDLIHENPKTNSSLVAFERIPLVTMSGFALFEVWRAGAWARKNEQLTPPPDVLVDRGYALASIGRSDALDHDAARRKLEREADWPSFNVPRSQIWARMRRT